MPRLLLPLFATVPVALAAWNGWVNDDAYILLRTVDNFIHGYGLRFNLAERVQAFTCPAWTLLLSAAVAVTREPYFTTVAVSLLVSALAAARLATAPFSVQGRLVALAALAVSQAYVDYSTSGLEGPLTHLVLAAFFTAYLAGRGGPRRLLGLTLLAALGMLNRLDLALLFLPALGDEVFRHPGRLRAAAPQVALGLLPLVAWEAFSVVYYGFPFPNTAYAKLNNEVPSLELAARGLQYLWISTRWDPLPLLMLAAAVATALRLRARPQVLAVVGAALYVAYTARIGGDFMVGRFLTPPLMVAAVVVASAPFTRRTFAAACAALVLLAVPGAPLTAVREHVGSDLFGWRAPIGAFGIEDERIYYFEAANVRRMLRADRSPVRMVWRDFGEEDARLHPPGTPILVDSIGYRAYFGGRGLHYLDSYALVDPLLARLPPRPGGWRMGHFERWVPNGYLETLRTGQNQLEDPQIAALYERLALVTRGPLWSGRRWRAILELNLGLR